MGKNKPAKPKKESAATPGSASLDLSYLREVSKGNTDFINEILDMFMSQIPIELSRLEVAVDNGDFKTIKNITHKLKSSVPMVGLEKELNPLLSEMEERAGQRSDLLLIGTYFARIKKDCNDVIKQIGLMRSGNS